MKQKIKFVIIIISALALAYVAGKFASQAVNARRQTKNVQRQAAALWVENVRSADTLLPRSLELKADGSVVPDLNGDDYDTWQIRRADDTFHIILHRRDNAADTLEVAWIDDHLMVLKEKNGILRSFMKMSVAEE